MFITDILCHLVRVFNIYASVLHQSSANVFLA